MGGTPRATEGAAVAINCSRLLNRNFFAQPNLLLLIFTQYESIVCTLLIALCNSEQVEEPRKRWYLDAASSRSTRIDETGQTQQALVSSEIRVRSGLLTSPDGDVSWPENRDLSPLTNNSNM